MSINPKNVIYMIYVNTEQRDKIRVAVQVGSECELNSWPDSSVD